MSDDDRARRRMGDATKGRIADLESGWDVPPEARGAGAASTPRTPSPASPGPPESTVSGELPRKKPRTQPPPAPGPTRSKPATPPPPVPRTKAASRPPPLPVGDEAERTAPDSAEAAAGLPPPATMSDSGFAAQQLATVAPDPSRGVLRRVLEATPVPGPEMRRSPLHPAADPSRKTSLEFPLAPFKDDGPRGLRGDPTVIPTGDALKYAAERGDPSHVATAPFEREASAGIDASGAPRADDTVGALVASLQAGAAGPPRSSIRPLVTLPRRRGILGDVRYVLTALVGVPRARREAAGVGLSLAKLLAERRDRMIALGRAAVVQERFDHPMMGAARDHLELLEEQRSRFAGQVAAADSELDQVKRERAGRAQQVTADIASHEAQLAQARAELEPLRREARAARSRAADIADQLGRLDARVKATEASLVSVKTAREDRAGVQADIATIKAERQAVQGEEPAVASQLDRLAPRMAALDRSRTDAERRIAELRETEDSDAERTAELVVAIEAKRKVVARSQADAETARDQALHGLAERLVVDRPLELGRAFEPIDELDVMIGERERRAMELRELLSSVDKRAIARGVAVISLIVCAAVVGVAAAVLA